MRRNLDISTLRSFVSVVDFGGVTHAANRLNLTQSAVSMQVKRLESLLGIILLDRRGRTVSPSHVGEQLLSYARRIVAVNDEAVDSLAVPRFEGAVNFGIPSDIVYPDTPHILSRFARDFPDVRVNLLSSYTSELLAAFSAGKLDLIVTTEAGPNPAAQTLATRKIVWAGAQGGTAWTRRPLPYATTRRSAFRPAVTRALSDAHIEWRAPIDINHETGALATTTADLSVMTVLDGTYRDLLEPIFHNGTLPGLAEFHINLHVGRERANEELGRELAGYVRETFAA